MKCILSAISRIEARLKLFLNR